MIDVSGLVDDDLEVLVERTIRQHRRAAGALPMLCPSIDYARLTIWLQEHEAETVVARRRHEIVGHLTITEQTSDDGEAIGWIDAHGATFDDAEVLDALWVHRTDDLLAQQVRHQRVWATADESVQPWLALGFRRSLERGVMKIAPFPPSPLPPGYALRRGTPADVERALALDALSDQAAQLGPVYERTDRIDGGQLWREYLADPTCTYLLIELAGAAVAHGAILALNDAVGDFPDRVHLTAVVVKEEHRQRGLARALADALLSGAATSGHRHAQTTWRTTDHRAGRYWRNYGFSPTLVMLERLVGD